MKVLISLPDGSPPRLLGHRQTSLIRPARFSRFLPPMKLITTLALAAFTAVASAAGLYDIPLKDIDGKDTSLKAYEGKVLLIVNVASKCGNTKQYKELQALHEKFKDEGLVVMGFPSNDFGGQEPGTNAEIKEFCSTKYNVTFPMFDKVAVKGPDKAPLYQALSGPDSPFPGDVKWNFGKFLVGRDGKIVARFEPKMKPDDAKVVEAIEGALKKK
jgi:glutathione peroxidase